MTISQSNYDKLTKKIKALLKEYGEKGFGIYLNEAPECIVLSPRQLCDGNYDFSFYHRNDDERCKYYGIAPKDRE